MPLIITSKKSYNPYGKVQRLRVARDEAAAAEKEEKEAARVATADAERGRAPLVRRAAERGDASAVAALKDEESLRSLFEVGGSGDRSRAKEEEEEEASRRQRLREEAKRRGKEETRTSDPRFDQQFALGGGAKGKEAPWYAKKREKDGEEGSRRRSSSSPPSRSRSRSRSRSPKKKKRSKKEKKKKGSKKSDKISPPPPSLLDSLRAERRAREEAEAARAAAVVAAAGRREAAAAAVTAATSGESGQAHRYNGFFGNGLPASRRRGASWRELGGGEARREVERGTR